MNQTDGGKATSGYLCDSGVYVVLITSAKKNKKCQFANSWRRKKPLVSFKTQLYDRYESHFQLRYHIHIKWGLVFFFSLEISFLTFNAARFPENVFHVILCVVATSPGTLLRRVLIVVERQQQQQMVHIDIDRPGVFRHMYILYIHIYIYIILTYIQYIYIYIHRFVSFNPVRRDFRAIVIPPNNGSPTTVISAPRIIPIVVYGRNTIRNGNVRRLQKPPQTYRYVA